MLSLGKMKKKKGKKKKKIIETKKSECCVRINSWPLAICMKLSACCV